MYTWIFWLAVGGLAVSVRFNIVLGVMWWRLRRAMKAELERSAQKLRDKDEECAKLLRKKDEDCAKLLREKDEACAKLLRDREEECAKARREMDEAHAAVLQDVERERENERARHEANTLHQVRLAHREAYELARVVLGMQREVDRKELQREADRARFEQILREMATKEAQAHALASAKRFAEALRLLYEVYGLARMTGCPSTIASALHNIALVTARTGDVDSAVALVEEGLQLARGHVHGSNCLVSATGVTLKEDGRVALYEQHLRTFKEVLASKKANAKQQEALNLLTSGKVEEAVAAFREAARVAEIEAKNPHLKVSNLINCANALGANDQADAAMAVLEEARIDAERLGPVADFLRTLIQTATMTMESIGMSQVFRAHMARVREFGAARDFESAEQESRKALCEARRKFGPRHYLTAVALDSIGVSLSHQGELGRALEVFEQAVEVAEDWEEKAGGLLRTFKQHLGVCREAMGFVGQNGTGSDEEWRDEGDGDSRFTPPRDWTPDGDPDFRSLNDDEES